MLDGNTDSEEVRQLVAVLVIPMLAYQFGDGLQIAFANALRGLADVKPMMYIFGFLLDWGTVGIWMGFPVGLTSAGIAFYLRFRQQTRTNYVHQL